MKHHRHFGTVSIVALAFAAGVAGSATASDLPTPSAKAPAAPAAEAPWSPQLFVRVGAIYAINSGSAKSYVTESYGGPLTFLPGVGADASNALTLGLEGGVFFTPNISLEVGAGLPQWVSVKTKGSLPGTPPSGTEISKALPGFLPVTVSYHFTNFGQFQPYVGVGLTPIWDFATRDSFNTGVSPNSSIGFVAQAGADFMIDKHWGVSFDAKRIWGAQTVTSTGVSAYPGVPLPGKLETQDDPWILSTGLTYRF